MSLPHLQNNPVRVTSPHPLETQIDSTISVWDIEDKETEDRVTPPKNRSRSHMPHLRLRMDKVYEHLNALCVEWATTTLWTVETTVVQSVMSLQLDISLKTVVTDEGLAKLWDAMIPTAVHLLMTILGTLTMMRNSTETENHEDHSNGLHALSIVINTGELEEPRIFIHTGPAKYHGEWLHQGMLLTSMETCA
uniref:Uncharacterized protein n=1 Tax=Moniliophthora roreri TaxID=221103 RepID=A0A0W0FAT2_MONRR